MCLLHFYNTSYSVDLSNLLCIVFSTPNFFLVLGHATFNFFFFTIRFHCKLIYPFRHLSRRMELQNS